MRASLCLPNGKTPERFLVARSCRSGRCAIWPSSFCLLATVARHARVPAAVALWWPSPCSSNTNCCSSIVLENGRSILRPEDRGDRRCAFLMRSIQLIRSAIIVTSSMLLSLRRVGAARNPGRSSSAREKLLPRSPHRPFRRQPGPRRRCRSPVQVEHHVRRKVSAVSGSRGTRQFGRPRSVRRCAGGIGVALWPRRHGALRHT